MSAHNIAAGLVLTCAVILTFSALFLALTAVPQLIRDMWAWINRTCDMWAESPHVRGAIERSRGDRRDETWDDFYATEGQTPPEWAKFQRVLGIEDAA